jgi:hypothetical protein
MRAGLLLLLLAAASAGCADSPAPPDPRRPVSLYLRAGAFLRVEYVDSAWMASNDPRAEARTRALALWRQYGTAGMDSVVLHVSNRAELAMNAGPRYTHFFRFTPGELGGAAPSAARAPDSARPAVLEIRPGEYIRAEYVDSALVKAAQFQDRHDEFLARARQVWGEHGAPVDSVIVGVSNFVEPLDTGHVPHSPRITVSRRFKADELRNRESGR